MPIGADFHSDSWLQRATVWPRRMMAWRRQVESFVERRSQRMIMRYTEPFKDDNNNKS